LQSRPERLGVSRRRHARGKVPKLSGRGACPVRHRARIVYGWANLYRSQIKEGESYRKLRPTYAIWLLGQTLLADEPEYAHEFRLRDQHGRVFLDHGGIWLLELSKFAADAVQTEEQRWLTFFNEAERLDEDALPVWMQTHEMRRAMSTLKAFSEQEHAYHAYQARQDYLREQQSIQLEFEDLRAEVEQARAAVERERAAAVQARATAEDERAAKEQERAAKEQAQAAAEQAHASTKQARAAAEQERAAKEEALAENERLKRLLADQSAPSGPGTR